MNGSVRPALAMGHGYKVLSYIANYTSRQETDLPTLVYLHLSKKRDAVEAVPTCHPSELRYEGTSRQLRLRPAELVWTGVFLSTWLLVDRGRRAVAAVSTTKVEAIWPTRLLWLVQPRC